MPLSDVELLAALVPVLELGRRAFRDPRRKDFSGSDNDLYCSRKAKRSNFALSRRFTT